MHNIYLKHNPELVHTPYIYNLNCIGGEPNPLVEWKIFSDLSVFN